MSYLTQIQRWQGCGPLEILGPGEEPLMTFDSTQPIEPILLA